MNVVKEIQRINELELERGEWSDSSSWHARYKDTAWIYAGNLDYDLTEGDIVCIFSQYGEIIHVELVRDQKTGKPKGFAFIQYEDQRSTILAVDNLGGANVLGRTIRVDHTFPPKKRKRKDEESDEEEDDNQPKMNVAPQMIQVGKDVKSEAESDNMDDEDPMAAYFKNKHKKSKSKKSDKSGTKKRKHEKSRHNDDDEADHDKSRDKEHRSSRHHERGHESSSRHRDGDRDRHRERRDDDRHRERRDDDRHRERRDDDRHRRRDSDRYR